VDAPDLLGLGLPGLGLLGLGLFGVGLFGVESLEELFVSEVDGDSAGFELEVVSESAFALDADVEL
jgi:hypothetical protein